MIKGDDIRVVEFNCRFGDPETQAVLPLLDGDLAEIMLACATNSLKPEMVTWKKQAAVCVVMASGGYPAHFQQGCEIKGIDDANAWTTLSSSMQAPKWKMANSLPVVDAYWA
jgi:phosphoribosylamine--glycine ligase